MSDKDVLEKAIQKAIDGGWDCFNTDLSKWDWQVGEGRIWPLHMSFTPNESVGLITYASPVYDVHRVIFNHEFAKALWGEYKSGGEPTATNVNGHVTISTAKPANFGWQHHLREMVISPDPIKYIGENI